jgi:hypothetical protein
MSVKPGLRNDDRLNGIQKQKQVCSFFANMFRQWRTLLEMLMEILDVVEKFPKDH